MHNITIFISYSRFDVDRNDVNYIAVSSNIALEGSNGGPEKYELYMKYGAVPTPIDYDLKSSLTASDSYVGTVLYRYCFKELQVLDIILKHSLMCHITILLVLSYINVNFVECAVGGAKVKHRDEATVLELCKNL